MKRSLALSMMCTLVSCVISSTQPASATPGFISVCTNVVVDASVKKGTALACLDKKNTVILQALRGPVVVNVFGSWCAPCQQEIPKFVALYATKKVSIVGIDVEESNVAAGRAFVIKKGITWPILFDANSSTKANFGPGVPVTWFLNSHGHVVYEKIGVIRTQAELNGYVTKYLGIRL
jgi:thiol-disulfide isomerase/thioredoxin